MRTTYTGFPVVHTSEALAAHPRLGNLAGEGNIDHVCRAVDCANTMLLEGGHRPTCVHVWSPVCGCAGLVHRNHLCVLLSRKAFSRDPPRNLTNISHFTLTESDDDLFVTWEELEESYPRYPREDKIKLTPEERCVVFRICVVSECM
jgi:hypothetical protein